jgi:hypothetical protein
MLKTVGFPSTRTGDQTIVDGNLVIGTAGKGIDFSADPSAPGMTSELLDDYEEGTWTPTDLSGAGLSITVNSASYTKIGRLVVANFYVTYPATGDASTAQLSLPFASSTFQIGQALSTLGNVQCAMAANGSAAATFRSAALATYTNLELSGADILASISYTV